MRLVSWNANNRFRDKFQLLGNFDLAVVQECEDPKHSNHKAYAALANKSFWMGKSKHKGLGVFLGYGIEAVPMDIPNTKYEFFLPLQLTSGKQILAIWAMGAKHVQDSYVAQIHNYLDAYADHFDWNNLIILGDFNSNANWDGKRNERNHSRLVSKLYGRGLESLYHKMRNLAHGSELTPTFYMHRKLERPYHIDYVFLPSSLAEKSSLDIGNPATWLQHSDHMPLFTNIALKNIKSRSPEAAPIQL